MSVNDEVFGDMSLKDVFTCSDCEMGSQGLLESLLEFELGGISVDRLRNW